MPQKFYLGVEGKDVAISNPDKIFYPASGFTKAQVIDYYIRIAPVLLPHLKNRPLTLKRYPEGVRGELFYEKQCPDYRPRWIGTAPTWSEAAKKRIVYCVINDLPSLVWMANLANLELHTSLALRQKRDQPTMLAFDLDPGASANVLDCAQVAIWLRAVFDRLKLKSFVKTSGSKGLQIYVPLNRPVTYDETKTFAKALAELMQREHPDRVTSIMTKKMRKGKVFIDWSQNVEHKTTVCVYSLRGKEEPTVSTPVHWEEVERALKAKKVERLKFLSDEVLKRVDKEGDLFAPVLKLKQKLPELAG